MRCRPTRRAAHARGWPRYSTARLCRRAGELVPAHCRAAGIQLFPLVCLLVCPGSPPSRQRAGFLGIALMAAWREYEPGGTMKRLFAAPCAIALAAMLFAAPA